MNLLEETGGCGILLLSLSADVRPADDVIAFAVSAWDQNSWSSVTSPAAAHFEGLATKWLLELVRLPPTSAATLCGGATAANIIALAAARDTVLSAHGWDVERNGLVGAPAISVIVGGEGHSSVFKALGVVGLGRGTGSMRMADSTTKKKNASTSTKRDGGDDDNEDEDCGDAGDSSNTHGLTRLPVDEVGAVRASGLVGLPPPRAPAIIVLQAGHVNTGAFDDVEAVLAWARSGPTGGQGKSLRACRRVTCMRVRVHYTRT